MIVLMYTFLDLANRFYSTGDCDVNDNVVRETLFEEIVNSIHVGIFSNLDEVITFSYEWFGSNPSG